MRKKHATYDLATPAMFYAATDYCELCGARYLFTVLCPTSVLAAVLRAFRRQHRAQDRLPSRLPGPRPIDNCKDFLRMRLAELRRESPERRYAMIGHDLGIMVIDDQERKARLIYVLMTPDMGSNERFYVVDCRMDYGEYPEYPYDDAVFICQDEDPGYPP